MSELRPKSLDAILEWWAQELGITRGDLWSTQPGVTLSGNPLQPGVLVFQRGSFVRISATPGKLERIHDAIVGKKIEQLFMPEFWQKQLPEWCGGVIGPTRLFYMDRVPESWKHAPPVPGARVRGLAPADAKAYADFLRALPPEEQESSGLEFGPQPTWGAFADKRLVGVASFDAWPEKIAHLHVGVRPSHRRKGIGTALLRATGKGALARRRILQFRAPEASPAAAPLARAAGFELFGETIDVRPAPTP